MTSNKHYEMYLFFRVRLGLGSQALCEPPWTHRSVSQAWVFWGLSLWVLTPWLRRTPSPNDLTRGQRLYPLRLMGSGPAERCPSVHLSIWPQTEGHAGGGTKGPVVSYALAIGVSLHQQDEVIMFDRAGRPKTYLMRSLPEDDPWLNDKRLVQRVTEQPVCTHRP